MSDEPKATADQRAALKHPIQPVGDDGQGVLRFKPNAIVKHLLENGPFNLNDIARAKFSRDDREQFAQLLGYSLIGASDLSYMTDEVLDAAKRMYASGLSEPEARSQCLRGALDEVREGLRDVVAALYGMHPDDLKGGDEV